MNKMMNLFENADSDFLAWDAQRQAEVAHLPYAGSDLFDSGQDVEPPF